MKKLESKQNPLILIGLAALLGCVGGDDPLGAEDLPPPSAECGNGIVEAGEECDAGGESPSCAADCTLVETQGRVNGATTDDGERSPQQFSPFTGATVLGQSNFTDRTNVAAGQLYPWNSYSDGTRYFVADTGNNRVLIWNSMPSSSGQAPDVVVGQADLTTTAAGTSASSLYEPTWVHSDGTKMYIADSSNNRILIWNAIPSSNGASADVVVGQPDMVSGSANNGGRTGATLSWPTSVTTAGAKLIVSDWSNNRVLVWNTIPTADGQVADVAVGQLDMTSGRGNTGGVRATTLNGPYHASTDGTRLFVADFYNRRVLVWNSVPAEHGSPADLVLGQKIMSTRNINEGGLGSEGLGGPGSVVSDGATVVVADFGNHRVLIWNSMPSTNGEAADVVLGQPDMTSNAANNGGLGADSLRSPWGVALSNGKLMVTDYENNRSLIWNSVPISNNAAADVVLGQPTMTSCAGNNGGGVVASSVRSPSGVTGVGSKLIVSDYLSHRVLIWNNVSSTNNLAADVVLGQPDMSSADENAGGLSAQSLLWPDGVETDGTKLFVADTYNNRILVWNTIPTSNNAAADIVLGQANMTSRGANAGGTSLQSLNTPSDVSTDGTRLFVADSANNRVLIWNTVPTSDHEPADIVLGQPDATTTTQNTGGVSGAGMRWPKSVASDGTRLYVADAGNNRVLVWNSIPDATGAVADFALGQTSLATAGVNAGGLGGSSLAWPADVHTDGVKVFVADSSNNRVLVWNSVPTAMGQSADDVIGQVSLTTNTANGGGRGSDTTHQPEAVHFDGEWAVVADGQNDRVLSMQ